MADHEYKIEGAFLHTRIMCVEKATIPDSETEEKYKNLGIPVPEPSESWFPIVFDLREIIAIRKTSHDDGSETCLYSKYDSWVVDADYEEVVKAWTHVRKVLFLK